MAVAAAMALGVAAGACSGGVDGGSDTAGGTQVACAINGALEWSETCTAERVALAGGAPLIVVRHADGGFRRFAMLEDGGLAEADGALRAAVVRNGDTLEVTIGSDRYRLAESLLGDVR